MKLYLILAEIYIVKYYHVTTIYVGCESFTLDLLSSANSIASRELIPFTHVKQVIFIAELAERSPIIMQNSSNPSSRKNLDVRPYDRTRCYF